MSDKTQTLDMKELKIVTGRKRREGFVTEYGAAVYELSGFFSIMYSYCMYSKRVTFLWTQSGSMKQAAGPLSRIPHRH